MKSSESLWLRDKVMDIISGCAVRVSYADIKSYLRMIPMEMVLNEIKCLVDEEKIRMIDDGDVPVYEMVLEADD